MFDVSIFLLWFDYLIVVSNSKQLVGRYLFEGHMEINCIWYEQTLLQYKT